jgi:chromosome segregation ATPase
MTVRTGEQQVIVDSPTVTGRRVEHMVQQAGGYLERSSGNSDGNVHIEARVPAARLDTIMDSVAALGKERRRHMTGTDVTDQYTDLEARLKSDIALRDRLQQLLGRATTLDEVLSLEKQIARLQADIDALQARLDQLKSQTVLAALTVNLERKRVYGPLAVVGRGVAGLVSKLFVIR